MIRKDWLKERITIAELETAPAWRGVCVDSSPLWQAFKAKIKEGDELWRFVSPAPTWKNKVGAAGVAILRDGQMIAEYTPLRS